MCSRKKYRAIPLILALIVFISSGGFSLDMHYCQGSLKSVGFFGKAKNCHEMAQTSHCRHHPKTDMASCSEGDDKDCCNNEQVHYKLDQDQQNTNLELSLNKPLQWFLSPYTVVLLVDNRQAVTGSIYADIHRPPLIHRDIYALFQRFLL